MSRYFHPTGGDRVWSTGVKFKPRHQYYKPSSTCKVYETEWCGRVDSICVY